MVLDSIHSSTKRTSSNIFTQNSSPTTHISCFQILTNLTSELSGPSRPSCQVIGMLYQTKKVKLEVKISNSNWVKLQKILVLRMFSKVFNSQKLYNSMNHPLLQVIYTPL